MPRAEFRLEATLQFAQELEGALNYIEFQLRNPDAADLLQTDVETAVHGRLSCPLAFEPVASRADREHSYYRIYIGNYIVFYCVVGDVMELRRFVYRGRNWKALV